MEKFTENDIYIVRFANKLTDGTIDDFDIVVIGERNAHKHFDVVCEANKEEDSLIGIRLYKGKLFKAFPGCVVDDGDPIREWKANEKEA